jgi:hypothetical protein
MTALRKDLGVADALWDKIEQVGWRLNLSVGRAYLETCVTRGLTERAERVRASLAQILGGGAMSRPVEESTEELSPSSASSLLPTCGSVKVEEKEEEDDEVVLYTQEFTEEGGEEKRMEQQQQQ